MNLLLRMRNFKRYGLVVLLLLFSVGLTYAQTNTVKGTVTSNGIPLPGVTVLIKGTSTGTTTDFDGAYQINTKTNDILVYSYIGFKTQSIIVKSNTTLNVVLEEDLSELDEVVVIGYGTQKKKEVTGAVVNLKTEEILRSPVSDLGAAIQGKVAGVNIQAASGRPGEASNVQIRGLGSLSPGALGPLYVVDGIPYEGNPNIAPEQIESIDILKDGASASVYGTRASNGVILITTKKGKEGKMKVDFSTYTGIQNITSGTPLMSTTEYLYNLRVVVESLDNDYLTFQRNRNALDFDTDFVSEVQNDNAIIQNVGLNLSGGVKNLTLNFNTNFFKQDGVLIKSGFNRLTNRLTGQYTKGKFKAFATFGFTTENRKQEPFALYEYSIGQQPISRPLSQVQPTVGQNGFDLGDDIENDIFFSFLSRQLNNIDERETKKNNFALNLEYEITKGLKYKINLGSNQSNFFRKFYRPQYLAYNREGDLLATASVPNALLTETHNRTKRETVENIFTYSTNFGKHNINLLGLISYERFNRRNLGISVVFDKNASNFLQTLGSAAASSKPATYEETSTLSGKLARIQYNYDSKYLLSASIRRDGSSKFGSENRFGDFYGLSAGWNIQNEKWFNIPAITNLKLRGSWAEVGNQNIPAYSFSPIIETGVNYPFGVNESLGFGQTQRRYADKNIKWETTVSKNIGVDLSLFKNKLNISAEVYQSDKKDMLLALSLPNSTGTAQPGATRLFNSLIVNAGNMTNKGVEIQVDYKGRINDDLKFSINGTFTKNENEVTGLNGIDRGFGNGVPLASVAGTENTTFLAKGYEAGAFFLLQNDGVIKTQQELDTYQNDFDLSSIGTPALGDLRYKDTNGDNAINDSDRAYSGSGQADFEAGLGLNLNYKNLDFSAQSYFSYGAEVYNGPKLYAYGAGRHTDLVHMWSNQNPNSDVPAFRRSRTHANLKAGTDYFLEDGTYLRIRTISLGYTIPNIANAGIDKARIYLTSLNPFTFTNYDGYDPEVGGDGLFFRGVDRGNYPVSRQFLLGVQISF